MTTDNTAYNFAEKIMDLVDNNPSGPLTIDRKWLLEKLEIAVAEYSGVLDNERDEAYQLGVDDGDSQARSELEEDYDQQIMDLENRISELEEEIEKAYAEGFATGMAAEQTN